ncbi:hypothetical protein D3C81_1910330 [compost metagenome]
MRSMAVLLRSPNPLAVAPLRVSSPNVRNNAFALFIAQFAFEHAAHAATHRAGVVDKGKRTEFGAGL